MSKMLMEKMADTKWKREARAGRVTNGTMNSIARDYRNLRNRGRETIQEARAPFSSFMAKSRAASHKSAQISQLMKEYAGPGRKSRLSKESLGINRANEYASGRNPKDAERRNTLINATGIGEKYLDTKKYDD